MRLPALALVMAASFGAFSTPARADMPPKEAYPCRALRVGDACTFGDGKKSTCIKSTCSKLDYSKGVPPGSVDYECVICDTRTATKSRCSMTAGEVGGEAGGETAAAWWAVAALALLRRQRRR